PTVTASPSSPVLGQQVTFTATVFATPPATGTPAGSVTFVIDGTGQTPVNLDGSGQASFSTSSLTAGTHTVVANYGGNASFAASSSPPLSEAISKADTTVALTSSGNTVFGQPVSFTATVNAVPPGAGIPNGQVQFTID